MEQDSQRLEHAAILVCVKHGVLKTCDIHTDNYIAGSLENDSDAQIAALNEFRSEQLASSKQNDLKAIFYSAMKDNSSTTCGLCEHVKETW